MTFAELFAAVGPHHMADEIRLFDYGINRFLNIDLCTEGEPPVHFTTGQTIKCQFRIAWVAGSDGACGEDTGIYEHDDLLDESNNHITCYEFEIPEACREYAWPIGAAQAFKENWTADNSLSLVLTDL